MNWSRTKLIFLIAFLALDLFLGFQLYEKRKSADIPPVGEETPKEQLENSGIEYPQNLPQIDTATYIQGEAMSFVEDTIPPDKKENETKTVANKKPDNKKQLLIPEVATLQFGQSGKQIQDIHVGFEDTVITSMLREPVKIPEDENFTSFLDTYVYQGSEYQLWKENTTENTHSYIFVQTFNGRAVFSKSKSQTGTLRISTVDGKIVKYRQIYLNFKKYDQDDEKDIVSPLNALISLYQGNYLPFGSTVDEVKPSYYNMIDKDLGIVKIFVPAWHVVVKTDDSGEKQEYKEYFVNAITGVVQTLEKPEEDTG